MISSLDEAALGRSEFLISRSMQAQASFPLVWVLDALGKGELSWRTHLGSLVLPLLSHGASGRPLQTSLSGQCLIPSLSSPVF